MNMMAYMYEYSPIGNFVDTTYALNGTILGLLIISAVVNGVLLFKINKKINKISSDHDAKQA